MSKIPHGEGWWLATDGKRYPPEQHPDYVDAPPPGSEEALAEEALAEETLAEETQAAAAMAEAPILIEPAPTTTGLTPPAPPTAGLTPPAPPTTGPPTAGPPTAESTALGPVGKVPAAPASNPATPPPAASNPTAVPPVPSMPPGPARKSTPAPAPVGAVAPPAPIPPAPTAPPPTGTPYFAPPPAAVTSPPPIGAPAPTGAPVAAAAPPPPPPTEPAALLVPNPPVPSTEGLAPGPVFTSVDVLERPAEEVDAAVAATDEADGSPSSRRGLILGLGMLVLFALLSFLAFRFLTGSESATGASSADAAVQQLIDSINNKDAVGFAEVFDPDEIDAWTSSFAPAIRKLEGETITTGPEDNALTDSYRSLFDSFELSITGTAGAPVAYDVEPLDAEGRIMRVRVRQLDLTVTAPNAADNALITTLGSGGSEAIDLSRIDGATVQIRDMVTGLNASLTSGDGLSEEEYVDGIHMDFVTVEKNGRWYINAGYSLMELARGGSPQFDAAPDFGRAYRLLDSGTGGADTPRGVVEGMVGAFETLDANQALDLIDPLSMPYVHDYRPVLADELPDEQDRQRALAEMDITVDALELGLSEWEGRTLVTFGNIAGNVDGSPFALDFTTWCATIEDSWGEPMEGCLSDELENELSMLDDPADAQDLLPDQVGVIVVERDGRWFFDPLGTAGYYMDQSADTLKTLSEDPTLGNALTSISMQNADAALLVGPIARKGTPASAAATDGHAGVAFDLSEFAPMNHGGGQYQVALARATYSAPATLVGRYGDPVDAQEWFAVFSSPNGDQMPAVVAATDGTMTVELFDVETVHYDDTGFRGRIAADGRPAAFTTFSEEVTVDGNATISGVRQLRRGVLIDPATDSTYWSPTFFIVRGEPGTEFTLRSDGLTVADSLIEVDPVDVRIEPAIVSPLPLPTAVVEPPPAADPYPVEFDNPTDADFADFMTFSDFDYLVRMEGGFFDGCGPNDPDVYTHVYRREHDDFGEYVDYAMITTYPSPQRAIAAHNALYGVGTPCGEANDVILEVNPMSTDVIRIVWEYSNGGHRTFHNHRLVGNSIVVTAADDALSLDSRFEGIDAWSGDHDLPE